MNVSKLEVHEVLTRVSIIVTFFVMFSHICFCFSVVPEIGCRIHRYEPDIDTLLMEPSNQGASEPCINERQPKGKENMIGKAIFKGTELLCPVSTSSPLAIAEQPELRYLSDE